MAATQLNLAVALLCLLAHTAGGARNCFSAIYSFGDSFTDTGNAVDSNPLIFHNIDTLPYGETYFRHPTGRCSNGRLVIDLLASSLGFPFLPPYLKAGRLPFHSRASGINFAVASGTALNTALLNSRFVLTLTPLSLDVQIGWFQELKEATCRQDSECQTHFSNALYVMGEMGGNDYLFSAFSHKPLPEIESLVPLAILRIQAAIEAMIKEGAKYILVQGIPPLGCSPSLLKEFPSASTDYDENGCLVSYNQLAQTHNGLLQKALQQLSKRYSTATIIFEDYYQISMDILKNHTAHGFTETFKTCCGSGGGPYNFEFPWICGIGKSVVACKDPSTYINWDGVHLTEAAYRIVADSLQNPHYTYPTLGHLIANSCL